MKKQSKKAVVWSVVAVLAVLVIVLAIYIADLTTFPGSIRESEYAKQVKTEGVKSTFHQGVIYRYPGIVPMLEVGGDYYEMGLQYGVLLRPEITGGISSMEKILKWNADEMGLPYPVMVGAIKFLSRQIASSLPQKYLDEIRGVADGSGLPYDTVLSCNLFYDAGMAIDCTGVLMRGKGNSIIQGRNNDTAGFGGEELAKMTVVVRHKATGKNAVTHMDQPLYMGVETGYNNKGLSFGEETLRIKSPNPGGFSLPYLIRMVMEECSTLDEIYPFFDKYRTIAAYGCVWSDLDAGRGAVVELTPAAWSKNELKNSILWNFNRIYDTKLAVQQKGSRNIASLNTDREAVASVFPKKSEYTVEDAVDFVRATIGPDGADYSWCGTKFAVCNWMASQMMVFDTNTDGFYMAVGPYFAARQNIYHFFNDFSRKPELFMAAVPLDPLVEKAAQIENRLVSKADKLSEYLKLAGQYNDDANIQFIVAHRSFNLRKMEQFADYSLKAYSMKPSVAEYALYAGMAEYYRKNLDKAASLLGEIDASRLSPEQELYRLTVLENIYTMKGAPKAADYKSQKQAIIDKNGAQSYYDSRIKSSVDSLGR